MPDRLRYTEGILAAGEGVQARAQRIKEIGKDMYDQLNQLVSNGQLTGPGISQMLQQSQARWDAACTEFADAENEFGVRTQNAFYNMMNADRTASGYF